MLEQATYTNHINEVIKFGSNGVYINYSDIHDYSWNYDSENDKISLFKRGVVNKRIPVVVICDSAQQGVKIINNLMEYTEKDVLTKEAGKLQVGDYYLKCYIIGSTKKNYLVKKGYLEAELEVLTDEPAWIKESVYSFRNAADASTGSVGGKNLDMNFDYPHDYTSTLYTRALNNTGFTGSDFEIIIYGQCDTPEIHIGDHKYRVNAKADRGEYISINSKTKKVTKTTRNGEKVNLFKYRDKESYIFEKIPSGMHGVTWEGDFGFDVILFEERSEPKWT